MLKGFDGASCMGFSWCFLLVLTLRRATAPKQRTSMMRNKATRRRQHNTDLCR